MESYWYNYDCKEYQSRDTPTTADEALSLIPDNPAARSLFRLYLEMGNSILESMRKTLLACVGQSEESHA